MRGRRAISTAGALVVAVANAVPAIAQSGAGPFGVARPDGQAMGGGIGAWLVAQQSWFNHQLTLAFKATASHGSGPMLLIALGAIYGVLHAAGPGHGKAVISAYLFATGETLRRGILMSAAAAFVQATVAIALVAVLGLVVGATAMTMDRVTLHLEQLSYAAMAAIGLWLILRTFQRARAPGAGAFWHIHSPTCGHLLVLNAASNGSRSRSAFVAEGVDTVTSAPPAVAAVLAGGVRPCTGALLILVFGLSQGAFWLGVVATLAMALGTAVTVAALASFAVGARGLASRLTGKSGVLAARALVGVELGAGVLLVCLGATLAIGAS